MSVNINDQDMIQAAQIYLGVMHQIEEGLTSFEALEGYVSDSSNVSGSSVEGIFENLKTVREYVDELRHISAHLRKTIDKIQSTMSAEMISNMNKQATSKDAVKTAVATAKDLANKTK